MRTSSRTWTILGVALLAGQASAFIVNNTGTGLAGGATDTNWQVTLPSLVTQQAVALNFAGNPFPYSAYAPNTASSQWISFMADGGNSLLSTPPIGIFTYSTVVDFTGSTGVLSGHIWSDNAVLNIAVGATNYGVTPLATNHAVGSTAWFLSGTAFSISGLSGVQTVAITIQNGVPGSSFNPDPTAFRAELNLQSVPEPFTMALMGGAAIVGYKRIRRRTS